MAHSGNLFGGKEDPSSSSSSLTFIHPNVHPPARLVQFRAGRMHMEGSTVTADTQKGILYVYRSEDTLVHFCWDLRPDASRPATTDSAPVIDLIVFPGEAVFEPIPQRERVYLFRYKQNPDSKLFFWMQEPLATTPSNGKGTTTAAAATRFGEDELVHAMQEALEGNTNNSLLLHSNSNASITSQSMMDPADDTQLGRAMSIQERERMVQDMITGLAASSSSGNINTNSLMTMAASAWPGNAGASTIATAGNSGGTDASMQGVIEEEQGASTGGNSNDNNIKDNVDGMDVDYPPEKSNTNRNNSPHISLPGRIARNSALVTESQPKATLSDLQRILQNIRVPASIDMASVLSPAAFERLGQLCDGAQSGKEDQQRWQGLLDNLPVGLPRNMYSLMQVVQSPQFRQSMKLFQHALQNGSVAPSVFGVPEFRNVDAADGSPLPFQSVEQFLRSVDACFGGNNSASKEDSEMQG